MSGVPKTCDCYVTVANGETGVDFDCPFSVDDEWRCPHGLFDAAPPEPGMRCVHRRHGRGEPPAAKAAALRAAIRAAKAAIRELEEGDAE